MDNDDLFNQFQDPYERLNEMEAGLLNHAEHIQNMAHQVKQNARLILQISDAIKDMAHSIDQLQKQQLYIYKLIKDQDESDQ